MDYIWPRPPKSRSSPYLHNFGKLSTSIIFCGHIHFYICFWRPFDAPAWGIIRGLCIFIYYRQFISEMLGALYTVQEMPEQPKESFFKGLFGGGTKSLDREELCKCVARFTNISPLPSMRQYHPCQWYGNCHELFTLQSVNKVGRQIARWRSIFPAPVWSNWVNELRQPPRR